jgi:hypothetical protein
MQGREGGDAREKCRLPTIRIAEEQNRDLGGVGIVHCMLIMKYKSGIPIPQPRALSISQGGQGRRNPAAVLRPGQGPKYFPRDSGTGDKQSTLFVLLAMRNSALSTCRASRRILDIVRKRGFHVSTAQALTHWEIEKRKAAERARLLNMAAPEQEERPNYKEWSHENLIKRVTELEHNLKLKTSQ